MIFGFGLLFTRSFISQRQTLWKNHIKSLLEFKCRYTCLQYCSWKPQIVLSTVFGFHIETKRHCDLRCSDLKQIFEFASASF